MPAFVVMDATLTLNSIDRSDHVKSVTIEVQSDPQDTTNMRSGGWKASAGGLKSGTVTVELLKDEDYSTLDAAMFSLLGQVVPFTATPRNAAVSAANPQYSGSILINSWTPLSGSPGTVQMKSYSYPLSGPLNRATS